MTSLVDKRSRRQHDAQASRRALLDAAHTLFDTLGYDVATVREIGLRAGVDPSLIARYFGGKEGLYLASLAVAPVAGPLADLDFEPHAIARTLLEYWDARGHSPIGRALASVTLTDSMRDQVVEVLGPRLVQPLTDELARRGCPDAQLRAEMIVALMLGVSVTRTNGTLGALSTASEAAIFEVLNPVIDVLGGSAA